MPSGRSFHLALGLLALLILLGGSLLRPWASGPLESNVASLFTDLLTLSTSLCCFWRGAGNPAEARGWRILGIAFLLQALHGIPRTVGEMLHHEVPWINPPLAVLLFVRTGLVGLAMLAWPLGPATLREGLRKALDGLIFAAAFFFIAWVLVLGPVFQGSAMPLSARGAILLYALSYAVLLGIAVYLAAEAPTRFLGPLGWLTAGAFLACVGNLVWASLVMQGRWYPTHPFNLTTVFFAACFFMAPWSARPVEGPVLPAPRNRMGLALGILLPYLPLLGALGVGMVALVGNRGHLDKVAGGIALTLLLLLLTRQFLALRDVQHSAEILEDRVQERTLDLQRAQELLIRTERMNSLGVLGSGLAHDLKNLVGIVGNYSHLVREDVRTGNPDLGKDLEALQDASNRALELTQRLMALGHQGEDCVFDLTERTQSLVNLLRAALPRSVRLEHEAEPVRLLLKGDPAALDQMVVNLVMNARDALPEMQGLIRVETGLEVAAHVHPRASLRIQDTGRGMSAEVQGQLFTPFFSTKAPGEGTGLGLASLRRTLHAFGGTVDVESAPGRGSTFLLHLPLAQPA
jgi:signal transduction histidine kinase